MKVNAFLRQRMGYNNVASLRNGIIGYERWVDRANADAGSDSDSNSDSNSNSDSDSDSNSNSNSNSNSKSNSNSNSDSNSDTNSNNSSGGETRNYFNGKNFLFDRRRLALDRAREAAEREERKLARGIETETELGPGSVPGLVVGGGGAAGLWTSAGSRDSGSDSDSDFDIEIDSDS